MSCNKSCDCDTKKTSCGDEKSKIVAGVLAWLLGSFGIHRFYLGQWWGVFYLLFFWTFIPMLISFGEAIYFLVMNDCKWNRLYNKKC